MYLVYVILAGLVLDSQLSFDKHLKSISQYCVKSVRIRIYSSPHFPAFGVNSKAFAYELNGNALKYTYLKNRKQCVRVNIVCSDFKDIISGVPQGSIVGPMLYVLK